MISRIFKWRNERRLRSIVKPRPDYARRCAAQLPPERRERFLRNIEGMV